MTRQGKIWKTLTAAMLMLATTTATAQVTDSNAAVDETDSLDMEYADSLLMDADTVQTDSLQMDTLRAKTPVLTVIHRAYDDRVQLRWIVEDYVSWRLLVEGGCSVLRMNAKTYEFDTLAVVKPLSVEEFKAKFEATDSLAAAACELTHGNHASTYNSIAKQNVNPFSAYRASEDNTRFFVMAMIIAEMRSDLAEAMGLGYTDRTAKRGEEYSYFFEPCVNDTSMTAIAGTVVNNVKLGTYKPQEIDVQIIDSVTPPTLVTLMWNCVDYSTYDIERRTIAANGTASEWKKVNEQPFVMMRSEYVEKGVNLYEDDPGAVGVYEYRIKGYDSFGDSSLPTEPHRVVVSDIVPPAPPTVDRIVVDHPDKEHAMAHFYLRKDSIEDDVKGYLAMYRPRFASEYATKTDTLMVTGEWKYLTKQMLAPTDTTFSVDVSGLPSGDVCIVAQDTAGNMAKSIDYYMFLEDYKAPSAPENLTANVAPDGTVILRWDESPEPDVLYYDLLFANDTTHVFVSLSDTELRETEFMDSITPGLNQAFIYYMVRAVDYSGNISANSNVLRVTRPNFIPPQPCRIDSIGCDDQMVTMVWIQPNEEDLAFTRLMRRKRPSKEWELIRVFPADSVRQAGNFINCTDSPTPDPRNRYEYAMEAYNLNGVCSDLSFISSVLFTGPMRLDIPILLEGVYKPEGKETILGWNIQDKKNIPNDDYWFCVYRKAPGEERFKFLLSAERGDETFSDYLLKPGETAEYYIKIRFKDGRESQNSNTIKVSAPKAEE